MLRHRMSHYRMHRLSGQAALFTAHCQSCTQEVRLRYGTHLGDANCAHCARRTDGQNAAIHEITKYVPASMQQRRGDSCTTAQQRIKPRSATRQTLDRKDRPDWWEQQEQSSATQAAKSRPGFWLYSPPSHVQPCAMTSWAWSCSRFAQRNNYRVT